MIELRYITRPFHDVFSDITHISTEKVLQYRIMHKNMAFGQEVNSFWSEWQDVPTFNQID